jgi:hypothetical protein
MKKLDWVPGINEKYKATGSFYQISDLPNGNKAIKYLAGIAILYSPFFIAGHVAAGWLNFPLDGFSLPYQLAICFAALFYAFLGLWILRSVLLRYFSDNVTALTLLLVALATNYVQYVSVDSGMTHGYIFTLYALLLATTIKWHDKPTTWMAFLIGFIIGIGVISRPTEAVMIFIPLLYWMHDPAYKTRKWTLVKQNRLHVITAIVGGIVAVFPQLIYWKIVSGHWVYDVGSKFTFFRPHWQVLFGWEKGWFIYTPVALCMVAGLFFFKKNPFYRAVLVYFILNVWIVIAWDDWHYGASYSCRALVQSYAVMTLPMAAIIERLIANKFKFIVLVVGAFLIFVNLFQIWQYNKGILRFDKMNRRYYQAIFLNPHPSPLQMSLMDTDEYLKDTKLYTIDSEIKIDSQFIINAVKISQQTLFETEIDQLFQYKEYDDKWLQISIQVLSAWGAYDSNLITQFTSGDQVKQTSVRMQNGISKKMEWNTIEYFFHIPKESLQGNLRIMAETKVQEDIFIKNLNIKVLVKK